MRNKMHESELTRRKYLGRTLNGALDVGGSPCYLSI